MKIAGPYRRWVIRAALTFGALVFAVLSYPVVVLLAFTAGGILQGEVDVVSVVGLVFLTAYLAGTSWAGLTLLRRGCCRRRPSTSLFD